MIESKSRVAIYCRLSEEDRNKQSETDDSNSIQNQKSMLLQYSLEHGWEVYNIYSDDDYTGSDRRRPEFNRLLEDAKNRKFDIVLCKTQSRFTRELELVEKYIHGLFPIWGIRFISIVDNADTANKGNKKSRQINGLVNEWYLEDMSENIKSVLTDRRKNGHHIGAFALYGYKKDPDVKGHLIIDEEAAEVVRRIYRMTIEGKGPYQIARELSEEKIERPSYYLGKKGLGNHASNYDKENPYMWRGNQVTTLIARPEYIGKTVNFRTFKNSYKDKKTKRADKEDWVVFDDTQEPIVDEETWMLAQKLRQNVRKADPMGEPNVLTGKIYCADCGAPMYNHRQRKGRERIYYTTKGEKRISHSNPADFYECSTYNLAYQKYDRHCTCHHISTKALKSIIL